MFQQNPDLTPSQAHCILRTTADDCPEIFCSTDDDPGDVADCKFDDGHSACMGHGLLDVCAAVDMALACREGDTDGCCACDPHGQELDCDTGGGGEEPPEPPGGVIRTDVIFNPPQDGGELEVPDWLLDRLRCLANKRCACVADPQSLSCTSSKFVNVWERMFYEVEIEICTGPHCWRLPDGPPRTRTWAPGETISFQLVPNRELLLWQRAIGMPLTLRLYSKGVPIEELLPAPNMKQSRSSLVEVDVR
jgi:hypothetical protein